MILPKSFKHRCSICRPDAGHPRKVISSRVTTDINQNKVVRHIPVNPAPDHAVYHFVVRHRQYDFWR
jgi:hypothetical protein